MRLAAPCLPNRPQWISNCCPQGRVIWSCMLQRHLSSVEISIQLFSCKHTTLNLKKKILEHALSNVTVITPGWLTMIAPPPPDSLPTVSSASALHLSPWIKCPGDCSCWSASLLIRSEQGEQSLERALPAFPFIYTDRVHTSMENPPDQDFFMSSRKLYCPVLLMWHKQPLQSYFILCMSPQLCTPKMDMIYTKLCFAIKQAVRRLNVFIAIPLKRL